MREKIHKCGRPSKAEQLEIRRQLEQYFKNGISSPEIAARETGINIKTVRKYYKIFNDEIQSAEKPEFVEGCKCEIRQSVFAFENQILRLASMQNDMGKRIENLDQTTAISEYVALYKEYRHYTNDIIKAIEVKTSLKIAPTADVTLKELVKELLESGLESL